MNAADPWATKVVIRANTLTVVHGLAESRNNELVLDGYSTGPERETP